MARHSFIGAVAIAIALIATSADAADKKPEPLALQLSGSFAPAESDVLVRMRVAPDIRARELTVEWVSDDLSGGSHAISLEGIRSPASHSFAIKRMTEGAYLVIAVLRFSDGTEVRRVANVTVVGTSTGAGAINGSAQGSSGRRLPAGRK